MDRFLCSPMAHPFLLPQGRFSEVKGAARYSISRRIQLLYRLRSLAPMAILVVTLMTLQWQLDSLSISAREYGLGILVFCLVLFFVFFVTLRVLNKLINHSIVVFPHTMSSRVPARMIIPRIWITLQRPIFKKKLKQEDRPPISKNPLFSTDGELKAVLTIRSFIWYSNLDCLKPVGTCCRISGSTIAHAF